MHLSVGKLVAIGRWLSLAAAMISFLRVPLIRAQKLRVTTELTQGIAAFDRAKYGEAILYLERAVTLDPVSVTGHFYLAEAYDKAYSEACVWNCVANERRHERAIEEFKRALELEPSLIEAIKAIAWRSERPEDADRYYRKVLEIDPNDFETLYNLAVLDWRQSSELRQRQRASLRLGSRTPLIHSSSCHEIRAQNLARIEDGITLLERAEAVAESHNAEGYMGLLYRERADIQCGDQASYEKDLMTAAVWARRACDTQHRGQRIMVSERAAERLAHGAPPPGAPGACAD
jgi:tetratricopeptide (TPR) repeat protein